MDSWSTKQLKMMENGGNESFKAFIAQQRFPEQLEIRDKYDNKACEEYRKRLKMMVENGQNLPDIDFIGYVPREKSFAKGMSKGISSNSSLNCSSNGPSKGVSKYQGFGSSGQVHRSGSSSKTVPSDDIWNSLVSAATVFVDQTKQVAESTSSRVVNVLQSEEVKDVSTRGWEGVVDVGSKGWNMVSSIWDSAKEFAADDELVGGTSLFPRVERDHEYTPSNISKQHVSSVQIVDQQQQHEVDDDDEYEWGFNESTPTKTEQKVVPTPAKVEKTVKEVQPVKAVKQVKPQPKIRTKTKTGGKGRKTKIVPISLDPEDEDDTKEQDDWSKEFGW